MDNPASGSSVLPRPPGAAGADKDDTETVHIDSRHLLGNGDKVVINHQGQQYQLRQTKSGKLILTK